MTAILRTAMIVALCSLGAHADAATQWIVNVEASRIAFSGTHSGHAFTGAFRKWAADITFDPDDLASSKAVVRIDLASATTGDATYDKTLPTADWLDVTRSPTATFETTSFRTIGPGRYEADGALEMRGVTLPLRLTFDLSIDGDMALMSGRASLKRLDFGIGKLSDAEGVWVSLEIAIEITIVAQRKR
jgi:polyisoprenoid-binding protein YceI